MPVTVPSSYDALLLVSFGGPEGPDEVMPFLRNVVRGRNVPEARLQEVAERYHEMGGKSPLNEQCRALLTALGTELSAHGIDLPLYWGNRNWHPQLADTLGQMRTDGVQRALAFVTSSFSSYSGCRQYREAIEAARGQLGEDAPCVDKLRGFFNHPGYLETVSGRTRQALQELPVEARAGARLVFTAHSIPRGMAAGCAYEAQLRETAAAVATGVGHAAHDVVYQSRSGPPQVPWLEPDILVHLRAMAQQGTTHVVLVPVGFISDHMEVVWDLDREARELADELGLTLVRAATAGTHPRFVAMIRELIQERLAPGSERPACGEFGPLPDQCPPGCCPDGRGTMSRKG